MVLSDSLAGVHTELLLVSLFKPVSSYVIPMLWSPHRIVISVSLPAGIVTGIYTVLVLLKHGESMTVLGVNHRAIQGRTIQGFRI
jgi:hypothetical protein